MSPAEMKSVGAAPTIVKIGGVALERELDFIAQVKNLHREHKIALVHGGGKLISQWLGRLNIEPQFINGVRRTDRATLEVATAILAGIVNTNIVTALQRAGVPAVGLCGAAIMSGRVDNPDLGYVSETAAPTPAAANLFANLRDSVPVIAPLVMNADQTESAPAVLNMNADSFAGCLAKHLGASKLVFVTDMEGVLDSNRRRIPHMTVGQASDLVETGVASGGMIPKIKASLNALEANSEMDTYIIGGQTPNALTGALNGDKVGTNIYRPKV